MRSLLLSLLIAPFTALVDTSEPPATNHNTMPSACHLQIIPDYNYFFAYKAILKLSDACPVGTKLRVRKSSTTSVVRNGAPYQPIDPKEGAWNLNYFGDDVPTSPIDKHWTSNSWRWEYYDYNVWSERLQHYGRWVAAETLYAAPH